MMESLSLMQRRVVALNTSIPRSDLLRNCGCSSRSIFYEDYVPGLQSFLVVLVLSEVDGDWTVYLVCLIAI